MLFERNTRIFECHELWIVIDRRQNFYLRPRWLRRSFYRHRCRSRCFGNFCTGAGVSGIISTGAGGYYIVWKKISKKKLSALAICDIRALEYLQTWLFITEVEQSEHKRIVKTCQIFTNTQKISGPSGKHSECRVLPPVEVFYRSLCRSRWLLFYRSTGAGATSGRSLTVKNNVVNCVLLVISQRTSLLECFSGQFFCVFLCPKPDFYDLKIRLFSLPPDLWLNLRFGQFWLHLIKIGDVHKSGQFICKR